MLDITRQLPKFNRAFLKGLFWLLVLLFLASIVNVARGVYDIFLPRSEVRKAIIDIGTEIDVDNNIWSQHAAIVRNRGNADAKDVRATLIMPGGEFARVKIYSTESYQRVSSANEEEYVVELNRLAPGGDVIIFAWLNHPYTVKGVKPILAVTVSNGTVETMDTLTALEEIRGTSRLLSFGLTDLLKRFVNRVNPETDSLSIAEQFSAFGIYDIEKQDYTDSGFRYAFFSILALSLGFWVFLPRDGASVLIAISFGIFSLLYLEFTANVIWLVVGILFALVPFLTTKSPREKVIILGTSFFILVLNYPAIYVPGDILQLIDYSNLTFANLTFASFLQIAPYTVSSGVLIPYLIMAIVLTGTEL